MKPQRLDALVVAQRLATLEMQRAREAFARALGERVEAARRVGAVQARLETLGQHRKTLASGPSLTIDRYAWSLAATSDALDEQDTANEALHAKQASVEEQATVLAAAHRRHEHVSEHVCRQRTLQTHAVEVRQQTDTLETWMGCTGWKS